MRILFVSEYYAPKIMGGGEINLRLLAGALVGRGVEVSVLTSYHKGLKRFEIMDGVRVLRRLKSGDNPHSVKENLKRSLLFPHSVVREVHKVLRKEKFDVIHFIGTSIIAAPKLKNLGVKLFATIESYPTLCPKGDRIYFGKKECKVRCGGFKFTACQNSSAEIGKMKNRWFFRYNPLFLLYVFRYYKKLQCGLGPCNLIAISEYVAAVLMQHGHSSAVVPNAINVELFDVSSGEEGKSKMINESKRISEKRRVRVLYLGALIKSKGVHVLARALRGLNCRTDFYGEGGLEKEIKGIIKVEGIDATIHKPVSYNQIPAIYAQADIVVFPSIWPEPFGRIAIEAMAAGKAVIGSEIGGIKETIAKDAGVLVKAGSVHELHEALQKLIDNSKLRGQMGKVGKREALAYQEEKVLARLLKLYEEKK